MEPDDTNAPGAPEGQRSRFQEWLLNRFPDNPLVPILVFGRWFRVALVATVLLPTTLILVWLKILVMSPPGFRPVVKASVVDLVQAWSLARTARQFEAEGNLKSALQAWKSAAANNLANPDLLRGALQTVTRLDEVTPAQRAQAMRQVDWLLRLTGTNRADVGLAAIACDHLGRPAAALQLLNPVQRELSRDEEAVYLKSLFHVGKLEEFAVRWTSQRHRFEGDPELALYATAHAAGWGAAGEMAAAAQRLAAATETPGLETLANRLQLSVCAHGSDADGYRRSLERLERAQRASLSDEVNYWRLLAALGRGDEARQRVEKHLARPMSPFEVVLLAKAYSDLGLKPQARQMLDHYGPMLGDSDDADAVNLWLLHTALLVEAGDWPALEQLGTRVRLLPRAGAAFAGFGSFLEGRAQFAQGLLDQARASFARAADLPFPNATVAVGSARTLSEVGYPGVALKVLTRYRSELANDDAYWFAVFEAHDGLRLDDAEHCAAARKAYELKPENLVYMSNYAASLLTSRRQPEEALRLTFHVYSRRPQSLAAQVNHALALSLNQRSAEALEILQRVDLAVLSPYERSIVHLGFAEAYLGLKQSDRVLRHLELVNPEHLFPVEQERIAEMKAAVAPEAKR